MTRRPSMLLALLAVTLTATPLHAATKRYLAILLDTSSSMQQSDVQRYTMQLSQILSDLMDDGDELGVIRLPREFFASCSEGPTSRNFLRLDAADRAGFKRELDGLIQYNTGNFFAAPVRTAISFLSRDPSAPRMLLFIADSGGLGDCEEVLTRELVDLKRSGVTIAAINIGSSAGAFDTNPAFGFTTNALDVQGLIQAVALVYQRFLGAKQVQTGRLQNDISVEIAPFVDQAFLVVAADGPVSALAQGRGNPGAAAIDLNHRGGGETRGLDGIVRGYRIARLERPAAGRWHFEVPGGAAGGAWMLIQDFGVGLRLLTPAVPKGANTPLEVELFDQRTGQKIADTSKLPGLQVTAEVNGQTLTFRDDGQGGDRQAGDGVLTATAAFDKAGDAALNVHLQSQLLDQKIQLNAHVIEATWRLEIQSPKCVEVDRPADLSVTLQPIGAAVGLHPPDRIDVTAGGATIELRGDQKKGPNVFTGRWTPTSTGTFNLEYVPIGGSAAAQASAPIEVRGRLQFGRATPVKLGRIKSESTAAGQLDLGSADVRGQFDVNVSTPFQGARELLEVDLGKGWVPLGKDPQTLRLAEGSRRAWPLRLRAGSCPEPLPAGKPIDVVVTGTNVDGRVVSTKIPVEAEIVADPWLHCWWPVIAAALALGAIGILIHGYWLPSRFPPRLGVVLSPEEDLNEGFLHPIRAQRGSRSGFYRDARIYVCDDFRLNSHPRNAVARLRANRKQVRITPASGAAVWRQNAEGVWEQIPPGESTARFGDVYRNDMATLFFELRNA